MDAIILAAGNGIRTSLDYPKQFYPVNGKPCLALSLELFENIDEISKIIITYNEQVKDKYQKLIEDFRITKAVLVEGGETRQKSVFNALQHVTSDKVLIHEAARPLISKDFVMRILSYENESARRNTAFL